MKKRDHIFTFSIVISLLFGFAFPLLAQEGTGKPSNKAVNQKIGKLQIPFIANEGQADKKVAFYANTFGGTVFVTKDGEIVYALPKSRNEGTEVRSQNTEAGIQDCGGELHSPNVIHNTEPKVHDNHKSYIRSCSLGKACPEPVEWAECTQQINDLQPPTSNSQTHNSKLVNFELQGVALKETLVGAKVKEIKGEDKSATKINYFKGNDQKKWKSNISTYDVVDLGEVYNGIELKLKAYGNNVEKLFHVKPGADPDQIKINLSGIQPPGNPPPLSPSVRGTGVCPPLAGVGGGLSGGLSASGLWVNKQGQLVAETALGPVTFTKPVAYQEIDGKRVNVEVEYIIENAEYRGQKSEDINQNAVVKIQQCIEEWHMPHLIPDAGYWIHDNHESCLVDCESCIMSFASDSNSQTHNSPTQDSITPQLSNSGTPQLTYGFKVASYDKTKELIIDPLLASTFLGGTDEDYASAIAVDSGGNVYVTGYSKSSAYPTTTGAYQASNSGSHGNVIISKLDGDLSNLLASTYIGGSYVDKGYSIAIDNSGNVYVTGNSCSSDYPTTTGAYQTSNSGSCNVIISKLNSDLTTLLASTYIGGSYLDYGYSIALDSSGNVYVAGATRSNDYPTTTDAYQTIFNSSGDNPDIIISKLDGNLSNLLASTYLGGESSDEGFSITLDSSNNVYITGNSSSEIDYPTTTGTYKTGYFGNVIVSKLNSDLTTLLASTYIGGSYLDYGYSIALDNSGNIYITGYSSSSDYPTTTNAYQTSKKSNYWDIIISKLNNDLTTLLASTYIGGSNQEYGSSLAVDSSSNVYITGNSYSSDYPTTTGAYQTSYSGSLNDVIVSKLDSDLTTLKASTYLGNYSGSAIALDKTGNVYVAGSADSSNFPVSNDGYDNSFNGGSNDIFVSKLDSDLSASPPSAITGSPLCQYIVRHFTPYSLV